MNRKKMDLFYVMKLNTSTIIRNDNSINMTFEEAKLSGMIISLADNQLLKFIRRLKDNRFDKTKIESLYSEREEIKNLSSSKENTKKINVIQSKIDELLFVPDLISIKVDTTKADYKNICKNGFTVSVQINDKNFSFRYKRLCAGAGQLRRNSSLFVNEALYEQLENIMMCGLTKERIGKINLAKFSAYYSLYTSSTKQVKKPRICVIPDFEFKLLNQKVMWISDKINGEKEIEEKVIDLDQNAFDGSGIISPRMAEEWRENLGLDYTPSSFIIRSAWIKGLVSVFDIHEFAKNIAKTTKIKDVWGIEYDIENIDVLLSTSQFKMYDKYNNFFEYMYYHNMYGHTFGVSRVNKREDNFMTQLNYQYIQSNNFTSETIKSLSNFSLDWIKKIMTGDRLYAMLLLIGCCGEDMDYNVIEDKLNSYIPKSLMYTDEILKDDYVRNKIINAIEGKIKQLKVGKLFVEGSYDFIIPDLYAFCEHAFGMEVKGLLREKESWNKRWVDKGSKIVSMQRSPLVAPSENQTRNISFNDSCLYWFKYIKSGMIMSIWDSALTRASDADMDGKLLS